ncbi:MAG: hypothetical protein J0L96_01445 [Anaerolineae bacterium]|jgi:hypothetical protein|nr:hypothetical protein [Anaerolineae bacterium]
MKKTKKRTRETYLSRILVARILFSINSFLWLVMGGLFVYKMIEDGNGWSSALVAFFFLVMALSMLIAARIIDQRELWVYVTCIVIAVLNVLLTFVGFPDVLYIIVGLLDLFLLANLIPLKSHYVKES